MAERQPSVSHLYKLMEACNRCSTVFEGRTHGALAEDFQGFSRRLRKTLARFAFELQNEIRRIDHDETSSPSIEALKACNPDQLPAEAEGELRSALSGYDASLAGSLPGHSRAMIRRQRHTLEELLEDLKTLKNAS